MKNAELTNIHVSQNVPQRSPMEVTIDGAKTCQVQIAQSVPKSSPLTWKLVGDPGTDQVTKCQNLVFSTGNMSLEAVNLWAVFGDGPACTMASWKDAVTPCLTQPDKIGSFCCIYVRFSSDSSG